MKNKDIFQNILLYEETIGHTGRGESGGGGWSLPNISDTLL